MLTDIVTIGDEILIGQIVDTNSAFIAGELTKIGIRTRKIHSIADKKESIINTLDEAIQRSDIVLLTGGLGPTTDDITKGTLISYFKGKPVFDTDSLNNIKTLFSKRGIPLTDRNIRQAEVSDNCMVIKNTMGSAPGMLFRRKGKIVVAMPGVPYEMKSMLINELIPLLKKELELPLIKYSTILVSGIPESVIAEKLSKWESDLDPELHIAYLPSPGIVRLRISITGFNKAYLKRKLKSEIDAVVNILGDESVFGFDNDSLGSVIGKLLRTEKKTLSIAESCTGGNIAHLITEIPGSSDYFLGSITAYSNGVKCKFLNVAPEDINRYGAVSKQVVEKMALGAIQQMRSDYSVAISGVAGPGGGTPEKPVGTVWIAIADSYKVYSRKYNLGSHRQQNITSASILTLNFLRNTILKTIKNNE